MCQHPLPVVMVGHSLKLVLHSFLKLIKTNYLNNHTLNYIEILKLNERRENEDHRIYITLLFYKDLLIDIPLYEWRAVLLDPPPVALRAHVLNE